MHAEPMLLIKVLGGSAAGNPRARWAETRCATGSGVNQGWDLRVRGGRRNHREIHFYETGRELN